MVDIQPRETLNETFDDGAPWCVHVEREFNESITLDITAFTGTPALLSSDGRFIKSGVRLRRKAETGQDAKLYVPALDADTTTFRGHLFGAIEVLPGSTRSSAALFTHGVVNTGAVPGGAPVTAQRSAAPLIRYIDHF